MSTAAVRPLLTIEPAARPRPAEAVFRVRGLGKSYTTGDVSVHALRSVDLELYRGELVVLLGASGSGRAGNDAAFFGGRGALLVNGTWGIGFGGKGWSDAGVRGRDGVAHDLQLGYGGVTLELNVTRSFRVGAGATYRIVSGVDLPAFTDDDVDGASFVVAMKFGRFYPRPR